MIAHALGWHHPDLSDFEFRLVIAGRPIVLKNSKQIITLPGRRPLLMPSSAAKQYMRDAAAQLRVQWASLFRSPIPLDVHLNAAIVSYLPTRSRTDASNLYEAPQDAMKACKPTCKPKCAQHAGVIVDDYQVRTHNGSDRRHDPARPRVEIVLTPYLGQMQAAGAREEEDTEPELADMDVEPGEEQPTAPEMEF